MDTVVGFDLIAETVRTYKDYGPTPSELKQQIQEDEFLDEKQKLALPSIIMRAVNSPNCPIYMAVDELGIERIYHHGYGPTKPKVLTTSSTTPSLPETPNLCLDVVETSKPSERTKFERGPGVTLELETPNPVLNNVLGLWILRRESGLNSSPAEILDKCWERINIGPQTRLILANEDSVDEVVESNRISGVYTTKYLRYKKAFGKTPDEAVYIYRPVCHDYLIVISA